MSMEPEPADVVALLRCHLAGDAEGIDALLASVDVRAFFAMTVGALVQTMENAGITGEQLDAQLQRWQADQR